MAEYTSNYNLEKPAETEFYDVAVQNGNMDKIDEAIASIDTAKADAKSTLADGDAVSIVDSADSSKTKRVLWSTFKSALGQLFVPLTRKINNKALSSDLNLTGEDIPTSDTDSTSISSQLSNKPANCTLNAGVNLDLITHSGMYRINTPTNGPSFDFGQLVVSGMLGGDAAAQIAFSHDGAQVEFRCGAALTTTPVWSEWVSLSTATPPQEVPLPLAGGVTELNVATAEKTQEGIVLVNAWVGFDSPVIANTETQVAIMPENMRPKKTVGVSAIVNSGDDENLGFARISIDSGGVMRILSDISFSFAVFSIAFPVGK